MSNNIIVLVPKLTLVFYFLHNLDASLAAKSLQTAILSSGGDSDCQLVPLNVAFPDKIIASTVTNTAGVTDICVFGYCPEDFMTLDLAEQFPELNISYFLYENNIQFGDKLAKILIKKEMSNRIKVYKPSSFNNSLDIPCGNSMCALVLDMMGQATTIDFGTGCRTAMTAVNRWYARDETSMQDLNIAWALRYDAEIRDTFAGSDANLTSANIVRSPEVIARTRALTDSIYNTHAVRRMTINESFKIKNTVKTFRTAMVAAEHIHDAYRRLIELWDDFIIVSRISGQQTGDGFLVSLAVHDTSMRAVFMQQLGISKFWMEGNLAVGFTPTNPLH